MDLSNNRESVRVVTVRVDLACEDHLPAGMPCLRLSERPLKMATITSNLRGDQAGQRRTPRFLVNAAQHPREPAEWLQRCHMHSLILWVRALASNRIERSLRYAQRQGPIWLNRNVIGMAIARAI